MSEEAAGKFAKTAIRLFPPYRWDEEQEDDWMDAVIRHLAGYSTEVINRAQDQMLSTRKKTHGTPAVADCIAYCDEAKRWLDMEQGKLHLTAPAEKNEDYGRGAADRLVVETSMGREAARDGWIGSLHGFIAHHKRLPSGSEIGACKAEAKETDEFIREALRHDGKSHAHSVAAKSAATILERRRELEQMVLG